MTNTTTTATTTSRQNAARAVVHGYPRQGPNRELKKATEAYWAGRVDADELLESGRALRRDRWEEMRGAGITDIPSNDFSFYDHVLDTAVLLCAIPARHRTAVPDVSTPKGRLDRYFAMARGTAEVEPLEMTKWFNTNYHYLVPELGPDTDFELDTAKIVGEFIEAREGGIISRPVLLGPVSFLLLAKPAADAGEPFQSLSLLDRVLPLYAEVLRQLSDAGAEWVQLDEPTLVLDQQPAVCWRRPHAPTPR